MQSDGRRASLEWSFTTFKGHPVGKGEEKKNVFTKCWFSKKKKCWLLQQLLFLIVTRIGWYHGVSWSVSRVTVGCSECHGWRPRPQDAPLRPRWTGTAPNLTITLVSGAEQILPQWRERKSRGVEIHKCSGRSTGEKNKHLGWRRCGDCARLPIVMY